jgi:predicted alpha-1,2-mannosidase
MGAEGNALSCYRDAMRTHALRTTTLCLCAWVAGCGGESTGALDPTGDAAAGGGAPTNDLGPALDSGAGGAAETGAGGAGPDLEDAGLGGAPLDAEGPPPEPDEGVAVDPGPANDDETALEGVDVFLATGGEGFAYAALTPAAQVPLGLVRLGPDTTLGQIRPYFHHFSGYHYDDTDVLGFSHVHFVGTGIADYGHFRFRPIGGTPLAADARPSTLFTAYAPMDKATERGGPGEYHVRLLVPDVDVSLTATTRAGVQNYVFHGEEGGGSVGHLFFDVTSELSGQRDTVLGAEVTVAPDRRTLSGTLDYGGPYTGRSPFTIYFSARFDPPPSEVALFDDTDEGLDTEVPTRSIERGGRLGALLRFDGVRGLPVRVTTGLSFVSVEAAQANRETEADGLSFREIVEAARTLWLDKLGRARIAGGTAEQRTLFFTSLYNLWRMPTRLDDVDGRYVGIDKQTHEGEGFAYYSDLSLWDTFRTLHPLYALLDVGAQRDVLRSLLAMGRHGGGIPRWPAATGETGGMDGDSANHLFAEGLLKGIDGVDYAAAYEIMKATADAPPGPGATVPGRGAVEAYAQYGYIPVESAGSGASQSLELMYADWALSRLAEGLGRAEDAERFRTRADGWRGLLDPESGFLVGRDAAGALVVPDSFVDHGTGLYTEGTAWQWRFHVPHDPEGLGDALGGPAALGEALETFFAESELGRAEGRVVQRLPDNYYWHGNEPDLHAVWMFALTDRPWRRDHWVREIQTRAYGADLEGLPGNDDGGTMSAWWVFSALGLYPQAGGDLYFLGPPLFPRAEVDLGEGAVLRIEAPGASVERRYVRKVWWNDVEVEGYTLSHAQLAPGGTLRFDLRSTAPR